MRRTSFIFLFISLFTPVLAQNPDYVALADSADNYIKSEKWDKAEATILNALRLQPGSFSNSLLLSNLGVVRTNLGKFEEALEDFRLALSIAPESTVVRNNRSRTLLAMGKYDAALEDLNQSLDRDSTQEWPRQMRGYLHLRNNEIEKAEADFNSFKEKNPSNPSVFSGLAAIAESRGDWNAAIALYDKSICLDDNPDTRFSRILAKIHINMYSSASQDIAESIRMYPSYPDLYLLRAVLNKKNYRNAEAEADKKIAIDKGADPQFIDEIFKKMGQ